MPEELGVKAWKYQVSGQVKLHNASLLTTSSFLQLVHNLDGMSKNFANPYVIFYPVVSRDGLPFPINKTLRDIQGHAYRPEYAWRGNIVVGKYRESPFSSLMDASMADFPLIKNWFSNHGSPQSQC